ncbi:hypothetical protein AMTRI_Chr02g219290 [Amborella trichopoda]|uniref:Cell wall protein n=1 Tax=Amborella trichopoda TaxID=13333 RepID=W1P708_AMBTC|nr:putative cell wall protein [Amborella trichopoda]ERN03381.1 hypothetical protein AMTR_s00003p00252710 [Amborella trichopoda]|eukprot:XP_006841706.1 putative cell wall protein [Amborella trichopoda]
MSQQRCSVFAMFLAVSLMIATTLATRDLLASPIKDADKKEPEWFIDKDGSKLIPGIGRVMVPSFGGFPSGIPGFLGGGNGIVGGSSPGGYTPGGDDTSVPNPGYEVPAGGNPSSGDGGSP